MNWKKKSWSLMFLLVAVLLLAPTSCCRVGETVGVVYVIHGGMDTLHPQHMWDASMQMFSYDPNHPVYKLVLWNSAMWSSALSTEFGIVYGRKYTFAYERIGGTDPFHTISDIQLADMKAELDKNTDGLSFEVDYACWIACDRVEHYPYPRFIYYGPDGPDEGENCTYCGEDEEDGSWSGCNAERYNVDGPVERLLEKGVSRIIMVDSVDGGVRFYKGFDVVRMSQRALDDWNAEHGTSITLTLVNDYSDLMERSYPTEPEGWTAMLGPPDTDQHVLLNGSPNPFSSDPDLAALHVEGIEASMSDMVSDAKTGVILMGSGLYLGDFSFFEPKLNDTLILNENIKSQILDQHPDMDPNNIVGAFGGVRELNPDAEHENPERTREM
ncbi:MAG: hypothetical protein JRI49_02875, partial [Deltaproteobacteria bacterium]|nr:hypothetical protein [Deltaproteobacteria bacterium]